jgi:WD40 repeat protein
VDQVCSRFEAAWKAGGKPRIEEFLDQAAGGERPALLRELVALELACRRWAGEQPLPEEYAARFPDLDPAWLAAEWDGQARAAAAPAGDEDLQAARTMCESAATRPETTSLLAGLGAVDSATVPGGPEGPAAQPPPSSVQVAGYEILKELGRGGMGVVYLARQRGLNRLVALKMILQGEHAGVDLLARFQAEAEAIAHLQHPNIVQIYEVGQQDGRPYFSLEYCASGSVEKRLNGTPLPPVEAAGLTERLARAVAAAHDKGIIHRDLKPANVLLAEDGTPKITDFGLAKRLGTEGVTATGSILGTPSYMAPEQAGGRSKNVGPATDVYALGAILYEMLTGRPPFRASTYVDTLLLVVAEEPVPPTRLQPKLPPDLETICLHCLQKEPSRRYASAGALADDLRRFLERRPILARPVGAVERFWRWCKRNPSLAAAIGLAATALVGVAAVSLVLAFYKTRAATELLQARERTEQRLGMNLAERGISLGEDGEPARAVLWLARSLHYVPQDNVALQETIRQNLTAWRATIHRQIALFPNAEPLLERGVAFSRDGRRILTSSPARTTLWDMATGERLVSLEHPTAVELVALSPDDRTAVTVSQSAAQIWNAATGHALFRVIAANPHQIRLAVYGPSGRILAVGGDDGEDNQTGWVQLWDIAASKALGSVLPQDGKVVTIAFSPDGKTIAAGSEPDHTGKGGGHARAWDIDSGKPVSPPLFHQLSGGKRPGVYALAFSSDGKELLVGNGDGTVALWDWRTGKLQIGPLRHRSRVTFVAFSPDGKSILTGSDDHTAKIWDRGTGELLHVLDHQDRVLAAVFAPDGKTAATLCQYGPAQVWDLSTGRRLGQPLGPRGAAALAYSPDGGMLLTSGEDGVVRLWRLTVNPVQPTLTGEGPVMALATSPDGKQALAGLTTGAAQLWDLATDRLLGTLRPREPGHRGDRVAVSFAADGKRALIASGPQTLAGASGLPHQSGLIVRVRSWEVDTLQETGTLAAVALPGAQSITSLALAPDGGAGAVAFATGPAGQQDASAGISTSTECDLFDIPTGRVLHALTSQGFIQRVAFSQDGKMLLTVSGDEIHTWDAETGLAAGPILKEASHVINAAFSADSQTIVTGNRDQTAQLWDVATGRRQGWRPLWHPAPVLAAALSPDGGLAVTGCADGSVRLWNRASALPLGPAARLRDKVVAVAFAADGRSFLAGGLDRALGRWRVPGPMEGTLEQIELRLSVETGMEIEENGVVYFLDAVSWRERQRQLPVSERDPI